MKSKEKLIDMLCRELDEISEKGQLSANDLDTVYKLAVAKEKLLRADELEEEMGYSQDGGWRAEGTYGNHNSYDMNRGNSYASRGMHYVRGHYSRDEGIDMIANRMDEMMRMDGLTMQDKEVLRKAKAEIMASK